MLIEYALCSGKVKSCLDTRDNDPTCSGLPTLRVHKFFGHKVAASLRAQREKWWWGGGLACLLKYNLSSNVPPSLCPQTEYLDFCDGVQQRFCLAWKVSHSEALREHTRAHTHTPEQTRCYAFGNVTPKVNAGFDWTFRSAGNWATELGPVPFASGLFFLPRRFFSPLLIVHSKRRAQQLGTYASSWDGNGLKSNLIRA